MKVEPSVKRMTPLLDRSFAGSLVVVVITCLLESCVLTDDTSGKKEMINVINLQESYIPVATSYAKWMGKVPGVFTNITVCYRVKIFYYRRDVTVFSYINPLGDKIRTDHNRLNMQVKAKATGEHMIAEVVTPLLQWSGFCVSLGHREYITVYFNGRKVESKHSGDDSVSSITNRLDSVVLMDPNGTIVLGQDQDAPFGVYDATQSLSGAVTDLNVWSRRLGEDEMKAISGCLERGRGDVLDWDEANFTIGEDSSQVQMELNETCQAVSQPFFMFPNHMEFTTASRLCKAFGGRLAAPKNESEQKVAYSLAMTESNGLCTEAGEALTWLGIIKNDTDNWRYDDNNENVTFFNWAKDQPNGEDHDNCVVMNGKTYKGGWDDQTCRKSYKLCALCHLKMPVILRFRGICDSTLYDDLFVMESTMNGKPYFRGYYRSNIYYTEDGCWRLESILKNDTLAVMKNDGLLDFPIGRHEWKFSHGFCGQRKTVSQSLTLTQCAENNTEFTCDDGTCIPINKVCDRREDCPDRSDEMDCSIVVLPQGYQYTLPPPSPSAGCHLPVRVSLNITLRSIIDINAIENKFRAELMVIMEWKDPRIKFKHLKSDRHLNIILPSEAKDIWVPIIDFLNADNNSQTKVDAASKITIKRLSEALEDDTQHSKEGRTYEGRDNFIRSSRKYNIVFHCSFNFFFYPFNTDYCSMIFRMSKNTDTYVTLEKYGNGTTYLGKDTLPTYTIGSIRTKRYNTDEPYSGLETVIELKHQYTTQIVTVFLPATLINIIAFATFTFKWFDFTNRIMVSLTALLVLSTLFLQINSTLPKTSYFKLIDIWFFTSILFTFFAIMTHTVVEYYHQYNANVDIIHKSSRSSFVPGKVGPEACSEKKLKRRVRDDKLRTRLRKPLPEVANKVGCTLVLIGYTITSVTLGVIAFSQRVMGDAEPITMENSTMTGCPE